jgi:hypothetical protein
MSKAKKTSSGKAASKRAKTVKTKAKTDWVGGLKEALAKKQTAQTWPGAGEAWKNKTKPH